MERGMFGILLISGLCIFASSLLNRQFHFINESKTWPEAQHYCREKHTDLATVNDLRDLRELITLTESSHPYVFLGLYRGWGWSLSDDDGYEEEEPTYWNWATGQPRTHYCGSMGPTGEWFATNCSVRLEFLCYSGSVTDISQRFTLGKGSMSWLDAQAYCRKLHTDLARVQNQLESVELQNVVKNKSVWIGLTQMSWMWSDGSQPSFVPWKPFKPLLYGPGDCGMLDVNSKPLGMTDRKCDEKAPFLCYGGPRRKHLVRLKLNADHVDVKNPAVLDSVLKWVKKKLSDEGASEDVNLSWWNLPEKTTTQEQTKTVQTHTSSVCSVIHV
uniref:macrophage mannose receptor 1-like n=1 Tax=Scatophagus argus TaxID=75038 RepID=UPI001ED7E948|nr:macrophage mannose receptor 1-like [Scatophagus argus]